MDPPECGRCRQDRNVPGLETVHRLSEAVKADELSFLRNVDLGGESAPQAAVAVAELLRKHIRHGDELDGSVLDAERILSGAGAAPAASHQGELNRIVLRCMNVWQGHSGQGGNTGDAAAVFQKRAARRGVLGLTHRSKYLGDTLLHFACPRGGTGDVVIPIARSVSPCMSDKDIETAAVAAR